jgi:hypothetical protein
LLFTNCTFTRNVGENLFRTSYNGDNITFHNSIIWGNENFSSESISSSSSNNNVVWVCSDIEQRQVSRADIGCLSVDPCFTDPDASDFTLQPNSPCIDRGDPNTLYNDPEDPNQPGYALWPAMGTLRNDMGAYGGTSQVMPSEFDDSCCNSCQ